MDTTRAKTITVIILLIAAVLQGPVFYYYASGFEKMILLVPFAFFGLYFTFYVLVFMFRYKKTTTTYQVIGLAVTFLIGLFTVTGRNVAKIDFALRKVERERIVEQVKNGNLKPNGPLNNGICHLPGSYLLPISNGGNDIWIKNDKDGLEIEFFTDRGFIDHYSAFVYSEKPFKPMEAFSNKHQTLGGHWYEVHY